MYNIVNLHLYLLFTGSILYSLTLSEKTLHTPNLNLPQRPSYDGSFGNYLLHGNFKHVAFIGTILSTYNRQMKCAPNYEISLRNTSSGILSKDKLKGIIFVVSNDFEEEFLLRHDIIELRKRHIHEITVLINQGTLPIILEETERIDATNEDWLPEFIDIIQRIRKYYFLWIIF